VALWDGMFILWFGAMKSGTIFYEEYYSVLDYKGFTVSFLILFGQMDADIHIYYLMKMRLFT
jgi:hypothetical protein